MKRVATVVLILLGLYCGAYAWYRGRHAAVWAADGRTYVILGSRTTWYGFRPLTWVDGKLTGMRFHLGAHRDPPEVIVGRAITVAGGAERLGVLRAFGWKGRADAFAAGQTLHLTGEWRLQLPDSAIVMLTAEGQPASSARSLVIAGRKGWSVEHARFTPLTPEMLRHERDQFYLYHLMRLVPLRSSAYQVTRIEDDSLGRPRLRVARTGRPDVELTFDAGGNLAQLADSITDPQSHARVWQRMVLTGQIERAGARWPRHITIIWNGNSYFDLEIQDLWTLSQLVDPMLKGPPPPLPRKTTRRRATSRVTHKN